MNKKAQQYNPPGGSKFGNASPILIMGVIIVIVPFFAMAVKVKLPGWISWIGGIVITIGIIHSIYIASTS